MAGIFSSTGLGFSEKVVGNQLQVVTSIPANTFKESQGQCDFLKRSTGDTIYIGVCGKQPSPSNYDIILTDAIPFFDLQGIPIGDIRTLGTAVGSTLSLSIFACS